MVNPSSRSLSPSVLHEAMARRLYRRAEASGEIRLPAVPGMIDEYVKMCDTMFTAAGVRFTVDELARLKTALEGELDKAFVASPRSDIIVSYNSPVGLTLNYNVRAEWRSIEGAYENWLAIREPPLFGTEPDARVWALAGEAVDPAGCRVLDIGAGTGRNALALARRGHPVDAVEMTPTFAETIRAEAQQHCLDVRVIERDVFGGAADLHRDYQLIVLSEVVSDFRTSQQLRHVLELAAQHLAPGGRLVFNAFLPRHGYLPNEAARQLGQQAYTTIFTGEEIHGVAAGLPLRLISDESVYDYEKAHLPEGSWPQTSWYADWVDGRDVFDVEREASPIEMRWLVYQKMGERPHDGGGSFG